MRRRNFIKGISSTAIAWPLAARAQQPGKMPTIGFNGSNSAGWTRWTAAFVQRLHELGRIEGRTIAIEYHWDEGRPDLVAEIAAEFVRRKVDIIVTAGPAVPIHKQATADIPIVFAMANDPVGDGFVASLARPGGNVTGLSLQATDLAGKRLELLRELVPSLRRLGIIFNASYRSAVRERDEVQAAARTLGLDVAPLEIRRAEDVAAAFAAPDARADALYIVSDALIFANRTGIITHTLGARLPTISNSSAYVQAGGLISYGPNFPHLFRRAAEMVDKILRGARPADIPVEQPTKFDLVINLATARMLGLDVPAKLVALADEVIE